VGTRAVYRIALFVLALAAASAAGLETVVLVRGTLGAALRDLQQNPLQLGLRGTLALLTLGVSTLVAGGVAYALGWQAVRLVHLYRYLSALHVYAATYVRRHAPLTHLGYSALGLPFTANGSPSGATEQPISAVLPGARGTLLLGDDGMGKSTALWECAVDLTRRRHVLAVALGRAPLPVAVSLAGYARAPQEPERPRLRFLAAQIRAFGHYRLAARLPGALQRWNVVLLCDGLDEVPDDARADVVAELAELASSTYPRVRLVVTCALNAYLDEPHHATSLKVLQRVVLTGLNPNQLALVLRQAQRSRRRSGERIEQLLATTRSLGLGTQISHPATLAALLELRAADIALPAGRSRLLGVYGNLLCVRASGAIGGGSVADLMGWLAATMRARGAAYVPLESGESAGEVLHRWAQAPQPLELTVTGVVAPTGQTAQEIDRVAMATVAAGILEWQPDGLGLRFTNADLAAMFAAMALAAADDGTAPLPAPLLQGNWRAPLVLWSGLSEDPSALAARALLAAERPHSGPREFQALAAPVGTQGAKLSAVALALGILLEGVAPALAGEGVTSAEDIQRLQRAETHLRDIFDRVQALTADDGLRQPFVDALVSVERESGCDLGGDIVALARTSGPTRIVRAQAISLLGDLGTMSAIDGLISLLPETDPMLRAAVDAALTSAGPMGLARLQEALRSPDELVRARAAEAFSQGGAAAIQAALADLDGADWLQRAAAARVLGTLKAAVARDALLALLDDSDSRVRVAAAWALGQVGTGRLVPTLVAHLSAQDPDLRAALARTLGAIRHNEALPSLTQLLDDTDARVRAAAAEALGQMGDKRAAAALRARLADKDAWAQAAAATALRRLEAH
jgi:HEAT repeat protein